MLKETRISPRNNSNARRWYNDTDMDLYVWFIDEMPVRFHLIWNKQRRMQSISWNNETGFNDGRLNPFELLVLVAGAAPLHRDNTEFNIAVLANRFLRNSENIDTSVADFIYARLLEYPGRVEKHPGRGAVLESY